MQRSPESAFCPGCEKFERECNPDPEDYRKPCESYVPSVETLRRILDEVIDGIAALIESGDFRVND